MKIMICRNFFIINLGLGGHFLIKFCNKYVEAVQIYVKNPSSNCETYTEESLIKLCKKYTVDGKNDASIRGGALSSENRRISYGNSTIKTILIRTENHEKREKPVHVPRDFGNSDSS